MSPHKTNSEICQICSGQTHDVLAEFCVTCERRMAVAFHRLLTDGAAVMVPVLVN